MPHGPPIPDPPRRPADAVRRQALRCVSPQSRTGHFTPARRARGALVRLEQGHGCLGSAYAHGAEDRLHRRIPVEAFRGWGREAPQQRDTWRVPTAPAATVSQNAALTPAPRRRTMPPGRRPTLTALEPGGENSVSFQTEPVRAGLPRGPAHGLRSGRPRRDSTHGRCRHRHRRRRGGA